MGSSVSAQYRIVKTKKPKLSLCMIAKDEEAFLGDCLCSVEGVVDEIIVLDTGSTDNTVKIAEAHGAKVFRYKWTNDYSAARNKAKEYATGDWILILDADERLDSGSKQLVLDLIANPAIDSYNVYKHDYLGHSPDSDYLVNFTGRLYRNHPQYKYHGRVHESIEPSIVAAGGAVKLVEVLIHHYGYCPDVIDARGKYEKYMGLMLKELEADPDNIYYLVHLGKTYSSRDDYELASKAFMRASELITADHPFAVDIFVGCANAFCMLNKPEEALKAIEQANRMKIINPELSFCRGNACTLSGRYQEAITEYESAIEGAKDAIYKIEDPSTCGYKAYAGIANAYFEIGGYKEALKYAKLVMEIKPDYANLHEFIARVNFYLGRYNEANQSYFEWLKHTPVNQQSALLLPNLYESREMHTEAWKLYNSLLNHGMFEDNAAVWLKAGNCAEALEDYATAERCCKSAIELAPDFAEAYDNLGRVYSAAGQAGDAIDCFSKAVEAKPHYANAYFNAGDVLYALGRFQEAAEVYLSGLNHSPNHAPAYFTIGNCCFRLENYEAASEAYRQALSIDPEYADAISNLALAQEAMAA